MTTYDPKPVTICDRCGEEIPLAEANHAGPELPTWEGATLCNKCLAAEIAPLKAEEVNDVILG